MQKTQNNQDNFEKEQNGRIIVPDCNTYYKNTAIKREVCWHKDMQVDSWNS
jgi:hypothetical protein